MKKLSPVHWSPLEVIKNAAAFLSDKPGSKIIDIGSGIGKSCIAAAQRYPDCDFYGIEQRRYLHEIALLSRKIAPANSTSTLCMVILRNLTLAVMMAFVFSTPLRKTCFYYQRLINPVYLKYFKQTWIVQ
nr:hypothetical protein [Pedobacter panaciterrae]